jgi:hypothetical protein
MNPLPSPAFILPLKGSFFNPTRKLEPPFLPTVFPITPPSTSKGAQWCVEEYVMDAFGWSVYESGVANVTITNADVPPNPYIELNTSNIFIKQIAPSLYDLYPKEAIVLRLTSSPAALNATVPKSSIFNGGVLLSVKSNVEFFVLSPNDTQPDTCMPVQGGYMCSVFDLQLSSSINMSVGIKETPSSVQVLLTAQELQLDWALIESNVGKIQIKILDTLDTILIPQVLKGINGFLANNTLAIPKQFGNYIFGNFSGLQFFTPSNQSGYICVNADVSIISKMTKVPITDEDLKKRKVISVQ